MSSWKKTAKVAQVQHRERAQVDLSIAILRRKITVDLAFDASTFRFTGEEERL